LSRPSWARELKHKHEGKSIDIIASRPSWARELKPHGSVGEDKATVAPLVGA